jgi:large subunit ribosomal protein L9
MMKIILLKDVAKLGGKHDVKNVSSGYALNFLIPNGIAIPATTQALKRAELEKAKAEGERKVQGDLQAMNIKSLDGITLTVPTKANEKGHLFAGLHREEIAAELEKQLHISIAPSSIMLEHPIKEIGEHEVEVKTEGKSVKFNLVAESQ